MNLASPAMYGKFERVELERYLVAASTTLSKHFAETARVSSEIDPVFLNMVFTITQSIWGLKVGERVAEYPADWWQAVKQRFAPRWALKRWPVKYKHVEIETRDFFPALKGEPGSRRMCLVKQTW